MRHRSLSDVQETAQFLAGEDLPRILLKSVLQKSELPDTCQSVSMINLTGYDGWLEKVCRRWRERETPQLSMKVLTLAKNLATAEFVEKSLALELMEDMMVSNPGSNPVFVTNEWVSRFSKSTIHSHSIVLSCLVRS